ncbi:hypothetical protein OE88DRAFT_1446560 [Heliocybe sulcata]|uniref:DUF6534 domain-containing protein n=1 Tax=Heliocybe sulcata TaxID=5364 RepID=A0A5C3NCQ5_9AGAM|nr:hypothetical protein OE88DRAFT_1446560 [Heliocybe sulcata]
MKETIASSGISFSLSSMATDAISLPSLLGPAFIGDFVAFILYGLTTAQMLAYLRGSRRDSPSFRAIICFLWTLDTLHMAIATYLGYHYFIMGRVRKRSLLLIDWSIVALVIVTYTNDMIIRFIFTSRIWLISGRNRPLLAAIIILTLLVFASATGASVKVAQARSFPGLSAIAMLLYLSFSSFVVADAMIAISLCTYLWKGRTQFKATNSLLSTLIIFSVHTGALTSTCALASLIAYATSPQSLTFIGIYLVTGKLYLNALLAYLNARVSLRGTQPRIQVVPLSGHPSADPDAEDQHRRLTII